MHWAGSGDRVGLCRRGVRWLPAHCSSPVWGKAQAAVLVPWGGPEHAPWARLQVLTGQNEQKSLKETLLRAAVRPRCCCKGNQSWQGHGSAEGLDTCSEPRARQCRTYLFLSTFVVISLFFFNLLVHTVFY